MRARGQVDVRRCWWELGLVLEESRLQVQDVFAQLVVFVLKGSEVLFHCLEFFDLFFEFLDVAFFPLTKCALWLMC